MYKDTKWAKQIISLQDEEGKWGCFHSLSSFYKASLTTEQALRRLERLGYTIEDECIERAVFYMIDCLTCKKEIPDRREKVHNWEIFTSLILATWIRRFTKDCLPANEVADKWTIVISSAFQNGSYSHENYVSAYYSILGLKPNGGRLIDFANFYPLSLLMDGLDEKTENSMIDYVLDKNDGIYYIYANKLADLPQVFMSKVASHYLGAIELLSKYPHTKPKFQFVIDWLISNQNESGIWDMGPSVNDKVYFPLSNDWRKKETRQQDCTVRASKLIAELTTKSR